MCVACEFIIFSSVFCAMFASSSHELTISLLALQKDKCREGTVGNWVLSTENLSERIQQLTLELTSSSSESHCLAPSKSCASAPMGDPHGEGPGNHLPGKLFPFIENLTTKRENLILVISTWRGNKSAYTHTHTKKIPVCVCTHTNMLATKNTGVLSSWTALFCLEYF